jgi:hypothetical protein
MSLELTDLIGPGVAVVAVAVGVWQYRLTSLREFIKPVREAQLKLYQEASSAAAQIATLQQESPEWIKARQEFLRLYYGPLAIDHFQIMPRRREAVQRAWCEPARPKPCACAFLQGVARTLVGIQGQAVGGRISGGCTGLSKATVDEKIEPENRNVGAPAAGLNKPKENRIGAFTTIACLRGLCYLLDITSFDARMS